MLSFLELRGARPRPLRPIAPQLIVLATILTLAGNIAEARNDEVYYKDGAYSTFSLSDQDSDRYGLNEHPADLSPDDLQPILQAITHRASGLFSGDGLETLFSPQQATLMAGQIAKGLRRARPDQDVTFVIQRKARKLVLMSGLALTSGRVFYADGKLNLIIGEHDRQRNREYERLFDTTGAVQPYALSSGKRKSNSGALKGDLLAYEGLGNQVTEKGKLRKDWIVIDVPQALASVRAQPAPAALADGQGPLAPAPAAAGMTSEEAAALQAEQEAMREELSRMREQLEATPSGTGAGPAAPAAAVPAAAVAPASAAPVRVPGTNIEERLRLLIELYQQGLITEDEYNAKRREILSEL